MGAPHPSFRCCEQQGASSKGSSTPRSTTLRRKPRPERPGRIGTVLEVARRLLRWRKFLYATPGRHLARVQITFRIHGGDMQEAECAAFAPETADPLHDLAGLTIELPHHHVHNVGNED